VNEMKTVGIIVNGIVAKRDLQPYIQLMNEDGSTLGQLTMAMARAVAADIVQMCARTEADAMILKFFKEHGLAEEAAGALLIGFRDFRLALDQEKLERWAENPDDLPGSGLPT